MAAITTQNAEVQIFGDVNGLSILAWFSTDSSTRGASAIIKLTPPEAHQFHQALAQAVEFSGLDTESIDWRHGRIVVTNSSPAFFEITLSERFDVALCVYQQFTPTEVKELCQIVDDEILVMEELVEQEQRRKRVEEYQRRWDEIDREDERENNPNY